MNVVSIQPLRDSSQLISVLAGTAAGGFPSPAADYYEPPISLDELLNIRAPHVWIVRVQGESMRDAGIYDGGVLIVDRSITARTGQIVLAYVDNQPLVKRLAKAPDDRWLLESAHPDYKTITPDQYGSIDVFSKLSACGMGNVFTETSTYTAAEYFNLYTEDDLEDARREGHDYEMDNNE